SIAVGGGLARYGSEPHPGSEAHGLASVVLAEVDRFAHVSVGFGLGLAGLENLERRELGAPAAHDVGGAEQDGGAFAPGRGVPGGKRALRGLDRLLRLGRTGPPAAADDGRDVARIDGNEALSGRDRP